MFRTCTRRYGALKVQVGNAGLELDSALKPMIPSNQFLHQPVRLREEMDRSGYLYFSRVVSRELATAAAGDVESWMLANRWTTKELQDHELQQFGMCWGIPAPDKSQLPPPRTAFQMSENVRSALVGTAVMSVVRTFFGGGVAVIPNHTLDLGPPGDATGFHMPSVYMNRGTKLFVNCWVPLLDVPLQAGPLVVVAGSSSHPSWVKVRQTYGSHDVETDSIHGDGTFSSDPHEVLRFGGELRTTAFEAGDLVLTTCYTMQSVATNATRHWRLCGTSRWIMDSDEIGADKRFVSGGRGLSNWLANRDNLAKYPRSMDDAKKAWGV